MKIIQINDNLKINIEQIYSLERINNDADIRDWEGQYQDLMDEYGDDPPMLAIEGNSLYKPEFGVENDPVLLEKYYIALKDHIIDIIGEKPIYVEKYQVILSTGLKINVSRPIYDKINEILENYIV